MQLGRKVLGSDTIFLGENHRPLDGVAHFPQVPRPGIGAQAGHGLVGEAFELARALRGKMLRVVLGEANQILEPRPQRRHFDGDDIEPEIEVFAERPVGHALFQITIGRRDDTHVGLAGDVFAEALVFAFLDQPEQLGLNLHGQVADFVEEQRAAFGRLHLAPVVLDGPRVRAAHVAEQFAFQQLLRQAGATDGDKGPVGELAVLMQHARNHRLARAAFAENENGRRRRRRTKQHLHDLAHRRRGEFKDRLDVLGFRFGDFLFQPLDTLAELLKALEPGEDGEELFALKRLLQKINGPAPHGFHGRFHVSLGGAHHHRHIRAALHDLGQQVQAALLNQIDVQQNGIELVLFEAFQRLFT